MEAILVLAALAAAAWLLVKGASSASAAAGARRLTGAARAAWALRLAGARKARAGRLRVLNALARNLQLALISVRNAPDFRRAASWAAQAAPVPAPFRQRQFKRFRPLLVRHFAERLAAGQDAEALTASLRLLVQALGVAPFEADYLRADAERTAEAGRALPAAVPFSHRLTRLEAEHEQRLAALRGLTMDDEMREQLLEAEETRYREAVSAVTSSDDAPPQPPADGRLP